MSADPTTTATGSLWLATDDGVRYPPPAADRSFDVLVLGGGLTGLTTALLLKRAGARVAVVEAGRVGHGVSGNNTAKVTALQATRLSSIRGARGHDVAVAYAQASALAVERVAALAAEEGIACDLRSRDAATVAVHDRDLAAVQLEADLARDAGLPVTMHDEVDLPYPTAGAAVLADQPPDAGVGPRAPSASPPGQDPGHRVADVIGVHELQLQPCGQGQQRDQAAPQRAALPGWAAPEPRRIQRTAS